MSTRTASRRQFLKLSAQLMLGAGLAGTSGIGYAREVEPAWVDVTHVRLALPRLAPQFNGYRIAQVSDIHMGDWMTREKLEQVIDLVNRQNADLIAFTGDFVTHEAVPYITHFKEAFANLRSTDGVVAVLGNHDYWRDQRALKQMLVETGIRELPNKHITLSREGAQLHIAGVDDVWMRLDRLDLVLDGLPDKGAAILMAHEPDFADASASTGRFDLQISGHSHGGQVVIPFVGLLRLPPMGTKYPLGLYKVGNMLQYTNRGVGMVRPHVRFNCRPEITLYELSAGGEA
ncbi:MAG: metallophosphoesterase [Chloroflexota bacterium]|nr:metallophosphoesterase [Chloroflexota bacterium]